MANDTIEQAIEDIRNGRVVIVVDDENRENEGDLVMAAEKITPAAVNFMAREGRGLICVPMEGADLDRLGLSLMVKEQKDNFRTAFTVSVDAAQGITTGISAYDRARTIQVMVGEKSESADLVKPGHLFPLRYREGGVLRRAGHTEASVDLARLAGLKPAGVICEILREDGTMARLGDLGRFARKHDLTIISIADLIRYRREHEKLVERLLEVALPTRSGDWKVAVYRSQIDDTENLAFIKGKIGAEPTLVRVHSECLTGDVFGSLRCDCGDQLQTAMDQIDAEGQGVLLYMRQEGRGIGLVNKLKAYQLQDQGLDTVEANEKLGFPADLRDYGIGAQILADLGLRQIRLLTNNPKKIVGLEGYGLQVVDRVSIEIPANQKNVRYLETKQSKLGHLLTLVASPTEPKEAYL